jgi:hypothetical protein
MRELYSDFLMPAAVTAQGGPVAWNYEAMRRTAARRIYLKAKVSTEAAIALAEASPYPEGVKLGIRKQLANTQEITLGQVQILLGWAARRAQHTGRER